jgi:hypothetical protein
MTKKIIIESFIHHLATAAKNIALLETDLTSRNKLLNNISTWEFETISSRLIKITWGFPTLYSQEIHIPSMHFYTRGDVQTAEHVGMVDSIQNQNKEFFLTLAKDLFDKIK